MGVITDLRGRRFGRLTVPETAQPVMKGGHAYWPVICDCGARKLVRGTKLRDGSTVSCGCERADPEVRSAVRRGPEDDHQDDALEAPRPYFEPDEPPEEGIEPEACRLRPPCEKSRGVVPESVKRDLEEGVAPPAEDAEVRPGARQEAPDALDQAIYGTPVVRPAERRQPDGEQPDKANPPDVDWDALDL